MLKNSEVKEQIIVFGDWSHFGTFPISVSCVGFRSGFGTSLPAQIISLVMELNCFYNKFPGLAFLHAEMTIILIFECFCWILGRLLIILLMHCVLMKLISVNLAHGTLELHSKHSQRLNTNFIFFKLGKQDDDKDTKPQYSWGFGETFFTTGTHKNFQKGI